MNTSVVVINKAAQPSSCDQVQLFDASGSFDRSKAPTRNNRLENRDAISGTTPLRRTAIDELELRRQQSLRFKARKTQMTSKSSGQDVVDEFLNRIHPERRVDKFSYLDGTLSFYLLVRAVMLRNEVKSVLDFGAGRGAFWYDNSRETGSLLRRNLQDLRFNEAEVTACDIDPIVTQHPCSHHQITLEIGKDLPFEDASFDLIVSDWTFEHVADPKVVASNLYRVLKPGGYICARTANLYSYVSVAARIIPNRRHTSWLRLVQPDRKFEDVFPTVYRMNTESRIRAVFPSECTITTIRYFASPSYFFDNSIVYRLFLALHKFLPTGIAPTICFLIRKPT